MPVRFLKRKIEEYEEIKRQITLLTREVEENGLSHLAESELKRPVAVTA